MIRFFRDLFPGRGLFIAAGCCVMLYLLAFFFRWLGVVPGAALGLLILLVIVDAVLLFAPADTVFARRLSPARLSNGDDNEIGLYTESFYPFPVRIGIIDEVPVQFQRRDIWFVFSLAPRAHKLITYTLRPVKRGEYGFGDIRVFVKSPLGLLQRRFTFAQQETLPVYPSFLQMRKYELLAASNRLTDMGIKKMRRVGHSMEFEQIRNYVAGDDQRSINWKATARRGEHMVNNYVDEKAQHVYCVIDKSRAMKMPFDGLSLLDYAINASLVLADVAMHKEDRAGLITVSEKVGAVVPADRRPSNLNKIMEVLYREKTRYQELHMEGLYTTIRKTVRQRSLIVLFTNFESAQALRRQLPFLKRIAAFHLLLVVFFENTALKRLANDPATTVEEVYVKTMARKFAYEKKQMLRELNHNGIQAMLTPPQQLTVSTINKYLELKARGKI